MNSKGRKKGSSRKKKVEDGPGSIGYLADITKESEMSVIAVYGDAMDKLGFEMARKANRNAEKRLTKTLNVYDEMANKNDAKYRKEKYELKEKLNKLRLNQQRVWREYANRQSNEVGTTATGILFRKAKLLEKSGILEEEEEKQRETEAQIRIEATRKMMVSRSQIERGEMNLPEDHEENLDQTQAEEIRADEELEFEPQQDSEEFRGAHWIDPEDLVGTDEIFRPEVDEFNDVLDFQNVAAAEYPDVLYDVHHGNYSDQAELQITAGERDEDEISEKEEKFIIATEKDQMTNLQSGDFTGPLQRMHTSPMMTMTQTSNNSVKDKTKRRVKSTMALPDIVMDSTSEATASQSFVHVQKEESSNKSDQEIKNLEHYPAEGDNELQHEQSEKEERLLPHRKQAVHSNMIQPAYFNSRVTSKTKIKIPATPLTPPQIRRVTSSVTKGYPSEDSSPAGSPKPARKISAGVRRISSPANPIQRGPPPVVGDRAATPKESRKLTAKLRRISSPTPPSPTVVLQSRSPSPVASPETPRGGSVSPQAWSTTTGKDHSNGDNRKRRDKYLLESKLYVPKPFKHEKRYIVPDKQEMLQILEEQKKELQKRIDRFLSRQMRRSRLQQE